MKEENTGRLLIGIPRHYPPGLRNRQALLSERTVTASCLLFSCVYAMTVWATTEEHGTIT